MSLTFLIFCAGISCTLAYPTQEGSTRAGRLYANEIGIPTNVEPQEAVEIDLQPRDEYERVDYEAQMDYGNERYGPDYFQGRSPMLPSDDMPVDYVDTEPPILMEHSFRSSEPLPMEEVVPESEKNEIPVSGSLLKTVQDQDLPETQSRQMDSEIEAKEDQAEGEEDVPKDEQQSGQRYAPSYQGEEYDGSSFRRTDNAGDTLEQFDYPDYGNPAGFDLMYDERIEHPDYSNDFQDETLKTDYLDEGGHDINRMDSDLDFPMHQEPALSWRNNPFALYEPQQSPFLYKSFPIYYRGYDYSFPLSFGQFYGDTSFSQQPITSEQKPSKESVKSKLTNVKADGTPKKVTEKMAMNEHKAYKRNTLQAEKEKLAQYDLRDQFPIPGSPLNNIGKRPFFDSRRPSFDEAFNQNGYSTFAGGRSGHADPYGLNYNEQVYLYSALNRDNRLRYLLNKVFGI